MSKFAFVHFAGKLPRDTQDKAVVAVAVCADFEGYTVIAKRTRAVENPSQNNKFTGLMALEEVFNYLYDNQLSLLNAGVSRVYLVTDSRFTYQYLTGATTNSYALNYLSDLYKRFSFGGPKELRIGVGVAELCFRNSAKSRCDLSLIQEEIELKKDLESNNTVFCFPDTNKGNYTNLADYISVPQIEGLEESTPLVEV